MDTKWKNIKSKAKSFLEKCWLSSTGIAVKLFCFVLAGFGIAFWYSVVVYRTYHPTGESLFFGILGNALFGAGQMILTAFLIMRKFREWDPGEKDAYVKWQNRWKIRNRRLQWIGGTALFDRFVVYVVLNERRNVYRNRMAIQLCIGLCHDFIGARSVCACRSGDESL